MKELNNIFVALRRDGFSIDDTKNILESVCNICFESGFDAKMPVINNIFGNYSASYYSFDDWYDIFLKTHLNYESTN